jgi:hypothetical protein
MEGICAYACDYDLVIKTPEGTFKVLWNQITYMEPALMGKYGFKYKPEVPGKEQR